MSFPTQISNRNFLSPGGFRFTLAKYPKIAYYCQSANIPAISVGELTQPTPFRPIPFEGVLSYQTLSLRFLVDEGLENYLIIHNWMRGLGVPEKFKERQDMLDANPNNFTPGIGEKEFADGTLTVLNSNFQPSFNIVFRDMFPIALNTLEFDAALSDTEYFNSVVEFNYLDYEIRSLTGDRLTTLK
tara:strand:+ start:144 stop:701 length:558 start_codon:yes stop_codon:yes gene_type:complete